MFYGGFGYYYLDWTYILVVIGLVLSLAASAKVNGTFSKYSRTWSRSGITGAEAARQILNANGIYDVTVRQVPGNLTDHFDPRSRTVNLSAAVYGSTSISAIGVAAHECGHVIQDAREYVPLKIRAALVPVANIGSNLAIPLIILGVIIGGVGSPLAEIGILMFSLAVLFQLVTLPVEFNASSRALKILGDSRILAEDEVKKAREVLGSAALTYVAAAASSILQLLRLVILFGGRRNDHSSRNQPGTCPGHFDGDPGKGRAKPCGPPPGSGKISVFIEAGPGIYHPGDRRHAGVSDPDRLYFKFLRENAGIKNEAGDPQYSPDVSVPDPLYGPDSGFCCL